MKSNCIFKDLKQEPFTMNIAHQKTLIYLIVLLVVVFFSSCSDNLRLLRIKAENENFTIAFDVVDSSRALSDAVKENISKFSTICNQNNILNFVKCNTDTSEVQILVHIFGVKQAQIFFDAFNKFVIFDKYPLLLQMHLYRDLSNADSVSLQTKFPPTVFEKNGTLVLENSDKEAKFNMTQNTGGIKVEKVDNNTFQYNFDNAPGGRPVTLSMDYLLVPPDQILNKPLPHNESKSVVTAITGYKFFFTDSLLYFIITVLGGLAAIAAISGFINSLTKKNYK